MRATNEVIERVRAPAFSRQGEIPVEPEGEVWVRSREGVAVVAGKIAAKLLDLPYVDVACIGATTVNIGNKAIAELRKTYEGRPLDLFVQPYFSTVEHDGEERTRIVLRVFIKAA